MTLKNNFTILSLSYLPSPSLLSRYQCLNAIAAIYDCLKYMFSLELQSCVMSNWCHGLLRPPIAHPKNFFHFKNFISMKNHKKHQNVERSSLENVVSSNKHLTFPSSRLFVVLDANCFVVAHKLATRAASMRYCDSCLKLKIDRY